MERKWKFLLPLEELKKICEVYLAMPTMSRALKYFVFDFVIESCAYFGRILRQIF